jgi:integrase
MPIKNLTQLFVDKVKPASPGQRIEYWDSVHQGFGLRVGDTGVKTFFAMPRLNGQRIRIKLGRHPILTVKEARERAARAMLSCLDGDDPRRPAHPTAVSFRSVAERFLHEYAAEKQAESTRTETRRILNKEVYPHWGDRDVHAISEADVRELVKRIFFGNPESPRENERKARRYLGDRTLDTVRKLFNWCRKERIIVASPCADFSLDFNEQERDRVLTDAEVRAVWTANDAQPQTHRDFVRLLFLTAQRRGEVAKMRWEDLDLERKLWTLPARATKARRAHTVPLSPAAIAILQALPRVTGRGGAATFVFTTNGDTPISCFSDIKSTIATGAPSVPDWRMHDIRRTIATNMQRLGTPEPVIEAVLNHAASGVTRKHYALHRYDDEKRQALGTWASRLENIVSDQTAKVIALRA